MGGMAVNGRDVFLWLKLYLYKLCTVFGELLFSVICGKLMY